MAGFNERNPARSHPLEARESLGYNAALFD